MIHYIVVNPCIHMVLYKDAHIQLYSIHLQPVCHISMYTHYPNTYMRQKKVKKGRPKKSVTYATDSTYTYQENFHSSLRARADYSSRKQRFFQPLTLSQNF